MSRKDLAYEEFIYSDYLGNEHKAIRIFIEHLEEGLNYVKSSHYDHLFLDRHASGKSKVEINLGFLSNFSHLKSFGIGFLLAKKTNINPLYKLTHLEELHTIKGFLIDLSYFTKLKAIFANNLVDEILDCKNYLPIKNLYFHPNTPDLHYLHRFKNLEYIRILTSKIESLDGIEHLPKLKELIIRAAPKLQNIKAASTNKNLDSLLIEGAKNLTDYSVLEGNDSIQELNVDTLPTVSFTRKMKKLKHLSSSNIIDGNLQPLLDSETLESIYIYPQKKHYSHKISEVEAALES